jgi:hypothetical protein
MKKCNFYFLLITLIFFFGCLNDDYNDKAVESYSDTLGSYVSKSPWKEDEVFIKKAKTVFFKNVDTHYFNGKYGVVEWNYAMSFGCFDESYIIVPILKNNQVSTVMKVIRKGSKIFFYENENPQFIVFFNQVLFNNIYNTEENIVYNNDHSDKR